MECERIQERASLFIDARLTAEGQEAFFAHLAECAECRQFLETSVRVRQIARSEHVVVPAGADEALFDAIAQRTARQRSGIVQRILDADLWHRRWTLPAPAFAVIVIAAIGIGILTSNLVFSTRMPAAVPGFLVNGEAPGEHQRTVVVIYSLPEEQVVGVMPASASKSIQHRTY